MHFLCARLVPKSLAWVNTFSTQNSPQETGVVTHCSLAAAAEQETCLLFMGLALVFLPRAFAFESILDLLPSEAEGTSICIDFLSPFSCIAFFH